MPRQPHTWCLSSFIQSRYDYAYLAITPYNKEKQDTQGYCRRTIGILPKPVKQSKCYCSYNYAYDQTYPYTCPYTYTGTYARASLDCIGHTLFSKPMSKLKCLFLEKHAYASTTPAYSDLLEGIKALLYQSGQMAAVNGLF